MIYLVYPSDPTTSFLDEVLHRFTQSIEDGKVKLVICEPSEISYVEVRNILKGIPKEASRIIFMGHGTPTQLFGGASEEFERRELIGLKDMSIFSDKTLLFMSCYSADLLKSSRKVRNFTNSIGFGLLPSDLSETIGKSYLKKLALEQEDIENFQQCLVEIFIEMTHQLLETKRDTLQIVDRLKLLINTKINNYVLKERNIKLANLLYYVRTDIHCD